MSGTEPAAGGMTVRDLLRRLINEPMDVRLYVGKGMGPVAEVERTVAGNGVIYLVIKP